MQLIASVSDKKGNNKAHFLKYCAKYCVYILSKKFLFQKGEF